MPILLEIVATSLESALAAERGGADRIELCVNLGQGGTSPSVELLKEIRRSVEINLNVMVRPRGGDYCYSDAEFETMKSEIQHCRALGANGVVLGILHPDKTVDAERTKELVAAAHPLSVTFHRAFDETPDPFDALEDIIAIGADTLLTSGQKSSAPRGMDLIRDLVERAGGRIKILAGAGINEANVAIIIRETGVQQIHVATGVQKNGKTDAGLVGRLLMSINRMGEMN